MRNAQQDEGSAGCQPGLQPRLSVNDREETDYWVPSSRSLPLRWGLQMGGRNEQRDNAQGTQSLRDLCSGVLVPVMLGVLISSHLLGQGFPGLTARITQAWWLTAVEQVRAYRCQLRTPRAPEGVLRGAR